MKNEGRVQSAAYFGIRQYFGLDIIYCPSRISKYMSPVKYENPATTSVDEDVEEELGEGGEEDDVKELGEEELIALLKMITAISGCQP